MLRRSLALAGALCLLALSGAASASASGLTLGFSSDSVLTQPSSSQTVWVARAQAAGAGILRLNVVWSQVAPAHRPAHFDAANPASSGYQWAATDASVRALTAAGARVLVNIWGAPRWAEQGRPARGTAAGTWRPDPTQLAGFATALARRYSGRTADPLQTGRRLPHVALWQVWNEPNLDTYLTPQWTRTRHGYTATSPGIYRSLLNAAYAALKRVDRHGLVVTAGTAPYGDAPGGKRMPPIAFDRNLFCLSARLTPLHCADPPHLDALSHHPYGVAGPLQHAYNADDAAVPDLYKVARVLRAAERSGHALPRGHKQLWCTEISWDSSPPDPQGVPAQTQARWLEQSFYVLWKQGVDTVLWLQLVDSPPVPNYADTYQAGIYFLNGTPKPSLQAFRFPLVAERRGSGRVYVWGRAPRSGSVAIEVRHGAGWRIVATVHARAGTVFTRNVALRGTATLRGSAGSTTSLGWAVGR